jgi:hypothetical protein
LGDSDGELLIEKLNKTNIGGKEVHVQATQTLIRVLGVPDALRRMLGSRLIRRCAGCFHPRKSATLSVVIRAALAHTGWPSAPHRFPPGACRSGPRARASISL